MNLEQNPEFYKNFNDGYHCYYDGGNRGNCRHNLFSPAYEAWHAGYDQAEKEDSICPVESL